ncbi:hypothetical protein BGX30_013221 [Mortierella sp. GBA39]|nr:hypothetical protein BGX30_013221 [Mortierella sp. GBA39]
MERSFSHLLRTSRLATFDKNINQIYTTSGKAKAIGDWGLKRNLPTVLRTHYLTIEQLDTAEHQTPFQSATSDFLFLQRWKENFPRSRPPQPQPVAVKKDLSTMTDVEFKKLLETAREKRQEWKAALSKGEVRPDEHLRFLNILTRHSKGSSIDTETSQASIGMSRTPANTSTSAPNAGSNSRVKVGPTYGFFEPSTPTIVQGRSLGRFRQNQVVGSLQPYYVHKAEIEADGRPNVVLSMSPPSPASWSTSSIGGGREMYSYNRNRYPQGAAAKAASSSSSETSPSEGTGHRKVVTRVQGLLETLDQPNNRA